MKQRGQPERKPQNEPQPFCGLISCASCGMMITAENKTKRQKNGKDWAEELNRLALQDHKNSAPSLTAVWKKKKKISSLSKKLERLLTGYLDQVIDQPDYCLQKAKLLSEKKSLEEEMTSLSHKQNDWLAPFQNRLKDAQSLDKIASDSDLFAKKVCAKNLWLAPPPWRKNGARLRANSNSLGECGASVHSFSFRSKKVRAKCIITAKLLFARFAGERT